MEGKPQRNVWEPEKRGEFLPAIPNEVSFPRLPVQFRSFQASSQVEARACIHVTVHICYRIHVRGICRGTRSA